MQGYFGYPSTPRKADRLQDELEEQGLDSIRSEEFYMKLALEQAYQAAEKNEVPIGAIVVYQGEVIGSGFNRREMWQDPTAHAEMLAIREASRKLGGWRLTGASLFVTLEPCAMCAGAILHARMEHLFFAAYEPKFGACGSVVDLFEPKWNHQVHVKGGVLETDSRELLQQFFRQKRR